MPTIDSWDAEIQALCPEMPLPQILYGVHISLKHKYLYTITPKCACSTVRHALRGMELGDKRPISVPMKVLHSRAHSPTLDPRHVGSIREFLARPDIFKFCFVRDPYTRILSTYLDRIVLNKNQKQTILTQLGLAGAPVEIFVSFESFLQAIAGQEIGGMDPHWRPQFFQTLQRGICYDYIGRYERFDRDIAEIGHRIHPEFLSYFPNARLNSTNAEARFDEFYTDAAVKAVNEIFEVDFTAFGYRMR